MPKSPCGKTLVPFRQGGQPIVGRWAALQSELLACPSCGYLAFDPAPTEEVLSGYYSSQYWELGGSAAEAKAAYESGDYRATAQHIADAWKTSGTPGETLRVHEVGCGYGATVHFLRRLGVAATGSDLSASAVETAHSLGNPYTFTASLEAFLEQRPSDAINFFFMSHSLEHVPNPAATVKTIFDRLRADGMFMFRVPNGMHLTSRLRSFYEYTWLQYPDHLHYFTPMASICLLEQAGFELVDVRVTPREDHVGLMYPAVFGRSWSDLPDPGSLLHALASNWLGMELEVVARKGPGPGAKTAELRERAARFEHSVNSMSTVDVVGGQNAASFAPTASDSTDWSYATVTEIEEKPLRAARDGKALESRDGARVHRSNLFVPVGQTLQMKHTLGPQPSKGSGIAEISLNAVLPYKDGDAYEVSILHNDKVVLREEFSAPRRVSRRVHVKAAPRQTVAVQVRPIRCEWPSFQVLCNADWITIA